MEASGFKLGGANIEFLLLSAPNKTLRRAVPDLKIL